MDFLSADSLPWLARGAASACARRAAAERLPHSLLLLSAPGLGAEQLAHWIAALGAVRIADGCARAEPALRACCCAPTAIRTAIVVRIEEDAQQIKVDQIRELIEALSLASYRGGYKVR